MPVEPPPTLVEPVETTPTLVEPVETTGVISTGLDQRRVSIN